MDKLSLQKQMLIIRLYLGGLSYDEIGLQAGIAKGSVFNVINELKAGRIPGIREVPELLETFRQIAADINKLKTTPAELFEGASILPVLRDLGIEPSEIKSWASMCKQLASDSNPQDFVRAALYLDELRRSTGQTPQALEEKTRNLREEEKKLEPVAADVRAKEEQLQGLNNKIKKVDTEISQREKRLDLLNRDLAQKEKRDGELSHRLAVTEEKALKAEERLSIANRSLSDLAEIGLSPQDFPGFSQRVAAVAHRHSIAPSALRNRLLTELEHLDAELGIESLVETKKRELAEIEQNIAKKSQEFTALGHTVKQMYQEKENLRTSMAEEQAFLHKEFEDTARIAKDAVCDFKSQLLQGIGDALQEVQKLTEHSLEVGQGIGRLEGTIEVNDWPRSLLALVKGDCSVKAPEVRNIVIGILKGVKTWKRQDPGKYAYSPLLDSAIETIIGEMEKWKV